MLSENLAPPLPEKIIKTIDAKSFKRSANYKLAKIEINISNTDSDKLKSRSPEISTTPNAERAKSTTNRCTTDSDVLKVRPAETSATCNAERAKSTMHSSTTDSDTF